MRKLTIISLILLTFSSHADICENAVNVDNCLIDTLNRIEKAMGYKRPNLFDPCNETANPLSCYEIKLDEIATKMNYRPVSSSDICEGSEKCYEEVLSAIDNAMGPAPKPTKPHFCELQDDIDACFNEELNKFNFTK